MGDQVLSRRDKILMYEENPPKGNGIRYIMILSTLHYKPVSSYQDESILAASLAP